jgi:hypothetical protein
VAKEHGGLDVRFLNAGTAAAGHASLEAKILQGRLGSAGEIVPVVREKKSSSTEE